MNSRQKRILNAIIIAIFIVLAALASMYVFHLADKVGSDDTFREEQ